MSTVRCLLFASNGLVPITYRPTGLIVNFPEPFVLWRRHECRNVQSQRSGKTTDFLRVGRADFIHQLKVVFKELNETTIWLEVIAQSGSLPSEDIVAMVAQNRELGRIIALRSGPLAPQSNDPGKI